MKKTYDKGCALFLIGRREFFEGRQNLNPSLHIDVNGRHIRRPWSLSIRAKFFYEGKTYTVARAA